MCIRDSDADRGQPPAGGVDCHGSAIERVPSNGQRPGWGNAGFDIEFILHTSERVLYLRANSEDTFRLWIAGIVAAGGRAPLQAGPKSKGGHVGLSKSGKIVVPAISKAGPRELPKMANHPHGTPVHLPASSSVPRVP